MATLSITPIYAAILGIMLVALSMRVAAIVRGKGKVDSGDGGNPYFTTVIRGQGNFIEYVPLAVILIGFAELGGTSGGWIHALGGGLVVGRLLHPFGMTTKPGPNPFRFLGTILTWLTLLVASILVLVNQLG